jgi:hypothetical protein
MNERIKQLAEQAWEYAMAVHDGHIVPPLNKEVWPIDKVLDEKFAELIVRECAGKVDWILAEGGKTQGDLIKEHFGVE